MNNDQLRWECIEHIGSRAIKEISYIDLYFYLTKTKNIPLENFPKGEIYDEDLMNIFKGFTDFNLATYNTHNVNSEIYGVDQLSQEMQKELISDEIRKHKTEALDTKYKVKEIVFQEYKNIQR
jgi:hypothetical protein